MNNNYDGDNSDDSDYDSDDNSNKSYIEEVVNIILI